jgi:serine protease inhibitor
MRYPAQTLLLGTSLLVLAGCGEPITGPEPIRNFSTAEEQVAGANTYFGLGLLRHLHGAESKPNLLISPLSASMALGMTMNGAAGSTYDAMRTSLGYGDFTDAEINEAYRGLIAQLRARDPKVEFKLANSIWHERTFQVKQPFLNAARDFFDAEVAALDFRSPSAPKTISNWAEQQTGGRIKNLIESIDPLEIMFLVNAVYFKAPWQHPFNPQATANRPFTRANGSAVNVPIMSLDRALPFLKNDQVHMVELPYADGAFSMVVLAPAAGTSLNAFIASLTPQRWEQWLGEMKEERVMLFMPKFRFDYDILMNDALTKQGMGIAFAARQADFTRIADRELFISRVQHKTFIDVHELGTEAAAATAVGMSLTSMPPELRFDRPFVFAIRERSSGTLLFIGRVSDPTATS